MSNNLPSPVHSGVSQLSEQSDDEQPTIDQLSYPNKRVKVHEAEAGTNDSEDTSETMIGAEGLMGAAEFLRGSLSADKLTDELERLDYRFSIEDQLVKYRTRRDEIMRELTQLDTLIAELNEAQRPITLVPGLFAETKAAIGDLNTLRQEKLDVLAQYHASEMKLMNIEKGSLEGHLEFARGIIEALLLDLEQARKELAVHV